MADSQVRRVIAAYVPDDEEALIALEESAGLFAASGNHASVAGTAMAYLSSLSPAERAAAATILGRVAELTDHSLAKGIADKLVEALQTESVSDTRDAAASALGHYWRREDVGLPLELARSPSPNLRYAVAKALALTVNEQEASREMEVLGDLARDGNEEVRGWAQFGLASG